MKSERELFEDYFKTTKFYKNMAKSLADHNYPAKALDMRRGKYNSIYVQLAFDAWQASANREGYKLVPLEPTQGMIEVGRDMLSADFGLGEVYKAMIGAVDE